MSASEGSKQGDAWLTKSKVNPFPIPGQLQVDSAQIRFALVPAAAEANLGWLEEVLGQSDLKQRLRNGEQITVFDADRSGVEISFPKISGGAAAEMNIQGRPWMVWFSFPGSSVLSLISGRKAAKQWKGVLGA
jgi:hypothetical protein